jgi:phytoene dehydrogenase-like protein
MKASHDVVIVGAGPNGLVAATILAAHGLQTLVVEAASQPGGGTRSEEVTLPGYLHDMCSAVHPMGFLSPVFRQLNLTGHGLEWIHPEYSAAHPLDGEEAVLLGQDVTATARGLGVDADRYARLITPLLANFDRTLQDVLQPPSTDIAFVNLARFGLRGILPSTLLAHRFQGTRARALLAGCAAHSILPLEAWGTAAVGLIFLLAGHATAWPVAKGGSRAIAEALTRVYARHGGRIQLGTAVKSMNDLPEAKAYVFDLSPAQVARIAGDRLPTSYLARLARYELGPGVFKIDYALSRPIPWRDAACAKASTVHVGGSLEEIAVSERAAWHGEHTDRPFVMVCQQSHFDSTRAPQGRHTGYAYCHVPRGSNRSMLEPMENQLERFAPGFRDCVLQRHVMGPAEIERYNPANTGGTITGGAATLGQIFFRPVARLDPYATPNDSLFLCSHATPPGGGVHGMCGFNAARSVLRKFKLYYDGRNLN